MSFYTEEDLRDFVGYVKEYLSAQKKEPVPVARTAERKSLDELVSIIVTMRYNAMLFESFVTTYSKKDYLLNRDLKQLPLHLNDDGLVSQIIVKWRLQRNK